MTCKRLAVTQRIVTASGYDEQRDALAHDWQRFLSGIMPTYASWLPFPNSGESAVQVFKSLKFDGILLTGGETPGTSPKRDETEIKLLNHAMENHIPVFGVCRGMQLMVTYLGGDLVPLDTACHVANRHLIDWTSENSISSLPEVSNAIPKQQEVNSYHTMGPDLASFPECFDIVARSHEDQSVEAVMHIELPLLGVMWHPERERNISQTDAGLFEKLFGWTK